MKPLIQIPNPKLYVEVSDAHSALGLHIDLDTFNFDLRSNLDESHKKSV